MSAFLPYNATNQNKTCPISSKVYTVCSASRLLASYCTLIDIFFLFSGCHLPHLRLRKARSRRTTNIHPADEVPANGNIRSSASYGYQLSNQGHCNNRAVIPIAIMAATRLQSINFCSFHQVVLCNRAPRKVFHADILHYVVSRIARSRAICNENHIDNACHYTGRVRMWPRMSTH